MRKELEAFVAGLKSTPKSGLLRKSGVVSALEAILAETALYPAKPVPYRWRELPEAFIGECNCYYPARTAEVNELYSRGLIVLADEELDDVPIWEPAELDDETTGSIGEVAPEQIARALAELRSSANGSI